MTTPNTCEPFKYGMNYAWNSFGNDIGGGNSGFAAQSATVCADLADMAAHCVEIVRVWLYADFRTPGIYFANGDDCVTGVGGTTQADIEAFSQCAADNGLKIMWNFFSFNANDTNEEQSDPDVNFYVDRPTIRQSIVDPVCKQAFMDNLITPITQFIVNAPSYADSYHSYDLFNEPEWLIDDDNPMDQFQPFDRYHLSAMGAGNSVTYAEMYSFLEDMTNTVRGVDTNACITIGAAGKKWVTAWEPLVDYNSPHSYSWDQAYFPSYNSPTTQGFTKPTMIGEYPPDGMTDPSYSGGEAGALPRTGVELLCEYAENDYFAGIAWAYTDTATSDGALLNGNHEQNMDDAYNFVQTEVKSGRYLYLNIDEYTCGVPIDIIINPVSNKGQPVLMDESTVFVNEGSISNLVYSDVTCNYTATYTPPDCPTDSTATLTASDESGNAMFSFIFSDSDEKEVEGVCYKADSGCSTYYGTCETGSTGCTITIVEGEDGEPDVVPEDSCTYDPTCATTVKVACDCKVSILQVSEGDPTCPQMGDIFQWAISGCDCPGSCGPVEVRVKAGSNTSEICWLEDLNILQVGPITDTSSIKFGVICGADDPCVNLIENGPCLNHSVFLTDTTTATAIDLNSISSSPILIDQILSESGATVASSTLSTDSRELIVIGQSTGSSIITLRMRDINNNYYDCTVTVFVNL